VSAAFVRLTRSSLWRLRAPLVRGLQLLAARRVKDAATVVCNPADATATPSGETASFVDQAVENTGLIERTGKIPVLLAGADHDAVMPANANALELSGWQENCRCDVSQFTLESTGHAFMAHRSLTTWTANVVRWLRGHDIKG